MGVTFIGNPFDQDEEYDDSDWDMNAVEEWIMPPQEVAFLDPMRATFDLPEEVESTDSDEDYVPEEDEEDDFENNVDPYFYDSNEEEEEEEELDYVTYPVVGENDPEPDKPTATDASNLEENSDTD